MIESILGFLAIGTWGFWLLVVLASIIYTAAIENEKYFLAIFTTLLGVVLYHKALLALNWQHILIVAAVYGLLGGAWSVWRWRRYVQQAVDDFKEENEIDAGSREQAERRQRAFDHFKSHDVNVSQHKSLITGWIALWPWSFLWNITGDFFKAIRDFLRGIYENITKSAVTKLENDLR
jgi:membrane protein implicated in regulation of membrane protease activity